MNNLIRISTNPDISVSTFRHNIDELLEKLTKELQEGKKIKDQADDFKNRSFFSRLGGSLTAQNDEDLANMISSLGGSLTITQEIIQCLLQIQSEKNEVLKGFHRALVDKIDDLQSNDNILDLSVRENLFLIFDHLKQQVEDKLEQAYLVEQHTLSIEEQSCTIKNISQRLESNQKDQSRLAEQLLSVEELTGQFKDTFDAALVDLHHQLATCSQDLAVLQHSFTEHQANINHMLNMLEEKNILLSHTARKNRIGFRDGLLFITSAGLLALICLQFTELIK